MLTILLNQKRERLVHHRRAGNKFVIIAKLKWLTLPFFILLLTTLLFFSNVFLIKNIICKTQYGPCSKKEEQELEEIKGKNLFLFKKSDVQEVLVKNFLNRKVTLQRVFPNTVVVVIEKRKPIAAFKLPNTPDKVYLVDREGKIIEYVQNSLLPVISLINSSQSFAIGNSLDEKMTNAAQIVSLTFKSQGAKEGVLENTRLMIYLEEMEIYYPLDRDPRVVVGALQLILNRSRMMGKLPKSVDLRYSNPVLRYE